MGLEIVELPNSVRVLRLTVKIDLMFGFNPKIFEQLLTKVY